MCKIKYLSRGLSHNEKCPGRGQATAEYALLLAAVALSALAAIQFLGLGIIHSPGLSTGATPEISSISSSSGLSIERMKRTRVYNK